MSSKRKDPPVLEEFEKTYVQDADCCDGGDSSVQRLKVSQVDGGGGPFWVIETERWAIDSIEELVKTLEAAGVQRRADLPDEVSSSGEAA